MDNQMVLGIIEIVITSVIVPLLAWGIKSLVAWIKTKTSNDTLEKYITFAGNAVEMAVKETTQTYVDSLKKEGKFDADAQKEAFSRTADAAKKLLTGATIAAIQDVYGDVDEWLKSKIESSIADNK